MPELKPLVDLTDVRSRLESTLRSLDRLAPVSIERERLHDLVHALNSENISRFSEVVLLGEHTLLITNSSQQHFYISVEELPWWSAATEYYEALHEYRRRLDGYVRAWSKASRSDVSSGNSSLFKSLPLLPSEGTEIDEVPRLNEFLVFIDGYESRERDAYFMKQFLVDGEWSGLRAQNRGKRLDRAHDFIESAIVSQLGFVSNATEGRMPLVEALAHVEIRPSEFVYKLRDGESQPDRLLGDAVGENILFFGPPGTGKSYHIEQLARARNARVVRTVFHTELHASEFIGTLKPSLNEDGRTSYRFQPGPFTNAWRQAWENPDEPVFLVIEELNRANAASVLSEVFVLLDRDATGQSRYEVDFPTKEMEAWVREWAGSDGPKSLSLPSNLWLYGTINSSDQGVFHLDTAFRRRWKYEHMPIRYQSVPSVPIKLGGNVVDWWPNILRALNDRLLTKLNVNEDRLIGTYFARFSGDGSSVETFPEGVAMYLWTDVLRHHPKDLIFHGEISKLSELLERISSDQLFLCNELVESLQDSAAL